MSTITPSVLVVIPARFGSSRFPGKPLAKIAGRSMISRVADTARAACSNADSAFVVATDDQRIIDHCEAENIPAVMTPENLSSGSDRALDAADQFAPGASFIVNLQGDAPFTPPSYVEQIIQALSAGAAVATPCIRLSWPALEKFRMEKRDTPFSGTTCVINENHKAIWFSKAILPAIRDECALARSDDLSPVRKHIGLYGYRRDALKKFCAHSPSYYEKIEGLEQLRLIDLGIEITIVDVEEPSFALQGVDTPSDLERLERAYIEFSQKNS